MEEGKKAHKGLLGYKVFIKKWSEEAAVEVLSGLLVDLVGYTEEEAVQLLGAELPVQIADNTTYTAAIYLGIAFENTGCTADIYYKDEHIIFDEEVPQIFDEAGALTEEAVKVFEKVSNRNRVNTKVGVANSVDLIKPDGSVITTFGNYNLVIDDIMKKPVRRPVQHRILEDKPTGYMPAVPLDRPGRGRKGCRGRGGRRNGQ